jgi:hypothetical protein
MTALWIQQLEGLGFEWKPKESAWEVRMAELKGFRDAHGHCNVPQRYKDNPPLGLWVSTQRQQYRLFRDGQPSYMTQQRIQQLEELGFEWGKSHESMWEERLAELEGFRDAHGHCNVLQRYKDNPPLGLWVSHQRYQYKRYRDGERSTLTDARIQQLEGLGFEWKPNESVWEMRLAELEGFRATHGHCNIPNQYKDNPPLGIWVGKQRYQYTLYRAGRRSHMTQQRIEQLEALGFKWEARTAKRTAATGNRRDNKRRRKK